MSGFLNLNKPLGITSHDCVARVRRLLRSPKVGHAGTLDPAASGVLPIAIGKATRLLQFLPGNKAYQATIRLGICTATDDLAGEAIAVQNAAHIDLTAATAQLPQFIGQIQQVPPNYSAIQVGGRRLYDLARAGEEIQVAARTVEVFKIEVLDWRAGELPEIDLAIACGSGTYIRSIARDLGAALGVGGTLAALIRTESCGFHLADSLTFTELEERSQQGIFQPIAVEVALPHLDAVILPADAAKRWCQGQRLAGWEIPTSSSNYCRVCGEGDRLLGIGEWQALDNEAVLIPKVVFN